MLPRPEVTFMTLGCGEACRRGRNAVVTMATEVRFVEIRDVYTSRREDSEGVEGRVMIPALLIRTFERETGGVC